MLAVAIGLALSGLVRAEPAGLLLHVPFDEGREARTAIGDPSPRYSDLGRPGGYEGETVEGVFGGARRFARQPALHYSLQQQYLPARGTIAFHVRVAGVRRAATLLSISDLQTGGGHAHLRVVRERNGELVVRVMGTPSAPVVLRSREPLSTGWHHVAWSWDEAMGGTLYLDGAAVAETAEPWSTIGVDPELLGLPGRGSLPDSARLDFDELFVFDVRLAAEEVRLLARENRPPTAASQGPGGAAWRRHRSWELGWRERAGLPRVGRSPLQLRQVPTRAARAWKVDCSSVIDGRPGGGFPGCAVEREGLVPLRVSAGGAFELVQIDGAAAATLRVGGFSSSALDGGGARQRVVLPEPARQALELSPAADGSSARIGEIALFARGLRGTPVPGPLRYASSRRLSAGPRRPLLPEDRAALATTKEPGAAALLKLPAWRAQHWRLDGLPELALDGLSLVLVLEGPVEEGALRLELADPRIPARRWLSLDVAIEARSGPGPHPLRIDIDTIGRWIQESAEPLWLTLVSEQPLSIRVGGGAESTRVELWRGERRAVLAEHRAADAALVRARFRGLSEARAWASHEHPEEALPPRSRALGELFGLLAALRSSGEGDAEVEALWAWTHKRASHAEAIRLSAAARLPGAPHWARVQRELFATAHRVLVDWLDRRQGPDGELGDGYGDDTDFVQNFPMVALIRDPGGRLARAAARVADRAYSGGYLRGGLNARRADTLHAYEAGLNAQPVAALLQWGEARFLLRMFESMRVLEERMLVSTGAGRLRFRSSFFGVDSISDDDGFAYDQLRNALLLHPAAFLAWRQRDPQAERLLAAWTDAWLDLLAEKGGPGRRPVRVARDGRVLGFAEDPDGTGFADLLFGLHELRGDARYREAAELWLRPGGGAAAAGPPVTATAALHLLDSERFAEARAEWARRSARHLDRVSRDAFGKVAYRAYLGHAAGLGEPIAVEALEATLRSLQLLEAVYAAWEPMGDRVWLPTNVAAAMAYGDVPDQRGQLWPRHRVSYEGYSELTAWLRESDAERLRVELFSFAPAAESGRIRVWLPRAGRWKLRSSDGQERALELHRGASFAWTVPGRRLQTLELERVGDAEDVDGRPDLALELLQPEAATLRVRVHNLGRGAAPDASVVVEDAGGTTLARRRIGSLRGVARGRVAHVDLAFGGLGRDRRLRLRLDPEDRLRELDEENNSLELAPLGRGEGSALRWHPADRCGREPARPAAASPEAACAS